MSTSTEHKEGAYKLPFELNDPTLLHQQCYYGGTWRDSTSSLRFPIYDPGTSLPFASCPATTPADVPDAVAFAHSTFQSYSKVNPRVRAKLLLQWNDLIEANRDDLATMVTYETGKPLAEAQAELTYALGFTWWFAGEAERIQGTVSTPSAAGRRIFTVKMPIGVAVALVPWNFPIAMILRKASAALAAGCTMLIKPSPETPLSVLALCDLALRAGFPPGALSVLTTDLTNTPALSEALCKHELVKKVSFTGSTTVGKLIARHCAHGLKKLTLELGGNCPFIVFDDADLDQALEALMALKWRHAGQACITANRVYIHSSIFATFSAMLVAATAKLKVGHGASPGTTMGPLTTPAGVTKTLAHIADAKAHGATVLLGGDGSSSSSNGTNGSSSNGGDDDANDANGTKTPPTNLPPNGYFLPPTILSNMTPTMLASHTETFGPLLSLYPFSNESEAVDLANATSMGLASYFFTKDVDRTWRVYEKLEAGMVGMNTGAMSAAESPFGGIKESGYGKESGKDVAVDEYLVTKTGTLTLQGHY